MLKPPKIEQIERSPSVKPTGCHLEEIQQIEEARAEVIGKGKLVIKTLSRYRTGNALWANSILCVTFTKHDADLEAIGRKLAKCSCACTCGEPVDPI